jgi:sec-independent protein translocase protein TatA
MGGASIWHWIVVGLIVVLLFGRGKISEMMGDVAKGIKAFKKGMSEDEAAAAGTTPPRRPRRPSPFGPSSIRPLSPLRRPRRLLTARSADCDRAPVGRPASRTRHRPASGEAPAG